MTPGTTDMMVRFAADQMETVEIVRVSHGAFRPIAFSPSIAETTIVEYDPNLADRVVFEDGEFKQLITVPFFVEDLQGEDPLDINLTYYDPELDDWTLAVVTPNVCDASNAPPANRLQSIPGSTSRTLTPPVMRCCGMAANNASMY